MKTIDNITLLQHQKNRRTVNIISVIVFIISLFLILRYTLNTIYINQLNNENYDSKIEDPLLLINVPAGYVPHYNKGNAYYQKGDCDYAIQEYQNALTSFSSHPEECSIRINLALSIIQKIDFDDLDTEAKVDNAIQTLLAARSYLTEENCANETDTSGHSEEAEQLKKDIDEMLKKLMQQTSNQPETQPDNSGESSDNNQNQQGSMSQHEQQIQQQLQEQMQDALQEQNQAQSDYESYSNDGYSPQDYSGKKW